MQFYRLDQGNRLGAKQRRTRSPLSTVRHCEYLRASACGCLQFPSSCFFTSPPSPRRLEAGICQCCRCRTDCEGVSGWTVLLDGSVGKYSVSVKDKREEEMRCSTFSLLLTPYLCCKSGVDGCKSLDGLAPHTAASTTDLLRTFQLLRMTPYGLSELLPSVRNPLRIFTRTELSAIATSRVGSLVKLRVAPLCRRDRTGADRSGACR